MLIKIHYLPANRPIPRTLVAAILADANRGVRVAIVRTR